MAHKINISLDDDEYIVREIRRHPIGLIPIYAVGIVTILALLFLVFIVAQSSDSLTRFLPIYMIYIALGLTIFLAVIFTQLVVSVYKSNELVITNENLIQILQFSPFSNKVSRLNLSKVQDVSVDQRGVFAHLFNYGTIKIETAGEAMNFVFRTLGKPNDVARVLTDAHEDYITSHPNLPGDF